jgi:hypothetical protein
MTIPDNRMRFSSALINFQTEVGLASQDHDNYPMPQSQARYDHMRMVVIALLSQQSSYDEPTEYRDGTPWFDLNSQTLKIRKDNQWLNYSEVIPLGEPDTNGLHITLSEWYNSVKATIESFTQDVVFSGSCANNGINSIPIPEALRQFVNDETRCFLHVNGLLVDPRSYTIIGNSTILLSGILLDNGDEFTVVLRRIPDNSYHTPSLVL